MLLSCSRTRSTLTNRQDEEHERAVNHRHSATANGSHLELVVASQTNVAKTGEAQVRSTRLHAEVARKM